MDEEHVLKTCSAVMHLGFESLSLRHNVSLRDDAIYNSRVRELLTIVGSIVPLLYRGLS